MLELLKLIHIEQERVEQELKEENPKLEFFENFFRTITHKSIKSYYEIDKCDLVVATLASYNSPLSLEQIKDAIYSNRNLIEDLNLDQYGNLASSFIEIYETEQVDEIASILKSNKRPTEEEQEESDAKKIAALMMGIAEAYNTTAPDFAKLFPILEEEIIDDTDFPRLWRFPLMQAISIIQLLSESKETYLEVTEKLEDKKIKKQFGNKYQKSAKEIIANFRKDFDTHMDTLRRYYDRLISANKSKKRQLGREKDSYKNIAQELYQMIKHPSQEITLKKAMAIPNDEIRRHVLEKIYAHNLSIYQEREKEYKELSANDVANYSVLLANNGISPSNYEVGTIMSNSLSDVENIIKKIKSIGIEEPTTILRILQITNLETISNYTSMFQRGIITQEIILENLSMLNPNSTTYENVMRNLALIQSKRINPRYFTLTSESLVAEHQTFKENLDVLERYQLISSLKTGMDASFIAQHNLQESIDLMIELGYEKQLEEKIELLNYKDKFKRLLLLKTLNIPVQSSEELETVLTTDKFFMPDSEIDDCIFNAVPYNLPEPISDQLSKRTLNLSRLEEYQTSDRAYTIGGVIISKNKVATNIANSKQFRKPSDRLIYGILHGSTLSEQEIEQVKQTLFPKKVMTKK